MEFDWLISHGCGAAVVIRQRDHGLIQLVSALFQRAVHEGFLAFLAYQLGGLHADAQSLWETPRR